MKEAAKLSVSSRQMGSDSSWLVKLHSSKGLLQLQYNFKQRLVIFSLKQRKLHFVSGPELLSFISPGFVDLPRFFYMFSYVLVPPLILFIEVPVFRIDVQVT